MIFGVFRDGCVPQKEVGAAPFVRPAAAVLGHVAFDALGEELVAFRVSVKLDAEAAVGLGPDFVALVGQAHLEVDVQPVLGDAMAGVGDDDNRVGRVAAGGQRGFPAHGPGGAGLIAEQHGAGGTVQDRAAGDVGQLLMALAAFSLLDVPSLLFHLPDQEVPAVEIPDQGRRLSGLFRAVEFRVRGVAGLIEAGRTDRLVAEAAEGDGLGRVDFGAAGAARVVDWLGVENPQHGRVVYQLRGGAGEVVAGGAFAGKDNRGFRRRRQEAVEGGHGSGGSLRVGFVGD